MKIWISEPTLGLPVPDMTSWGQKMPLKKTNPLHFDPLGTNTATSGISSVEGALSSQVKTSFANMVMQGLEEASRSQLDASYLAEKVVSDPTSVEAHEVTVAMAKANMSLSIAKSVIDRTITSFKEILNQR